MPMLEEYWNAVLRRLQSEVDGFNNLIAHSAERGRENELALARVLQALVPLDYAVGTGLLIDSHDEASKQCDLVLYNQADQPRLLAQTNQLLHPVETVRAVIEVKSTLDKDEVNDAAAKKESISHLIPIQNHLDGATSHPLFCLVGYKSATSPAAITKNLRDLPPESRPDLVCLIEPGLVGGPLLGVAIPPASPGTSSSADYYCGLTPLLHEGKPIVVARQSGAGVHEGGSYPIMKDPSSPAKTTTIWLGHPARALLLFMDGLLRGLAKLDARPEPISAKYISVHGRNLHYVPPAVTTTTGGAT